MILVPDGMNLNQQESDHDDNCKLTGPGRTHHVKQLFEYYEKEPRKSMEKYYEVDKVCGPWTYETGQDMNNLILSFGRIMW